MVLPEAVAGISALKTTYDLVKDLRKSNDPATLRAGIEELNDRLLATQEKALRLSEEREALRAELDAIKAEATKRVAFEDKAKNYIPHRTETRATVYIEKQPTDGNATPTYFCPHCYTNEKFAMLQPAKNGKWECPDCKNSFQVDPPPRPVIGVF